MTYEANSAAYSSHSGQVIRHQSIYVSLCITIPRELEITPAIRHIMEIKHKPYSSRLLATLATENIAYWQDISVHGAQSLGSHLWSFQHQVTKPTCRGGIKTSTVWATWNRKIFIQGHHHDTFGLTWPPKPRTNNIEHREGNLSCDAWDVGRVRLVSSLAFAPTPWLSDSPQG